MPASPDSPADRAILPNSAPGFIITPSPVPIFGTSGGSYASSSRQAAGVMKVVSAVAAEQEAVPEVDDVDALNMLLK